MPVLRDSKSTIATDPLRNFKFHVNIHHTVPGAQPLVRLGFMSLSGLNVAVTPIPYREGGNNTTTRKMPGQAEFSDITLSRGVVLGTYQSWYWMRQIFFVTQGGGLGSPGNNFRTTVDVLVMDHPVTRQLPSPVGTPAKLKFRLFNAWPLSLSYSDLDAGGNAVLIEQMTLAHEGFDLWWANSPGSQDVSGAA